MLRKILTLLRKTPQNAVAHALQYIRQLISRSPGPFYAHVTMVALEHLVDTATDITLSLDKNRPC